MCGISGIITQIGRKDHTSVVKAMTDILQHRGPDGESVWSNEQKTVYFGHRRLSIIDLSDLALQPMQSIDGRYVITYNGEIYNYKELRVECEKRGSQFKTQSDTEVIIECFRHWGTKCFSLFRGMWALAIFDKYDNQIVFSRDPFAIKPLYYGFINGDLYFASEPKALREAHLSFQEIDEVSAQLFIEYGSIERDEWTFLKRVKRFPHAHFSAINLNKPFDQLHFQRYWSPPSQLLSISMQDAAHELQRLIKDSISIHLRSDVPLGACLSGGLDSSTIVCLGSQLLNPGQQFTTFTTHYPSHPSIDETQWAKQVIDYAGAKAHFTEPTYENFVNQLDDLLYYQDEPFGSTSIFAQYCIFNKIHTTDVKVVLDGQGPDELLGGYHGFVPIYLRSLINHGQYLRYFKQSWLLSRKMNLRLNRNEIYIELKKRFFTVNTTNSSSAPIPRAEFIDSLEDRLERMTLTENRFEEVLNNLVCETNLPQLLRYEDRNSMRFSIESRVPFLEPNLVNFCLSLPANLKINAYTKAVMREATKGIIPDTIRMRVDKMGFPAPEVEWMKKAFNVDVQDAGSREWREIITKRWREQINSSANLKHAGIYIEPFEEIRSNETITLYHTDAKGPFASSTNFELLDIQKASYDAVLMLTWSDWHTELRSNRYHYATRFARERLVIFVQPDLLEEKYVFEETEISNFIILHVSNCYNSKQVELLKEAVKSKNINNPLHYVYNPHFANYLEQSYSPLVIYHATEAYYEEDAPFYCQKGTAFRENFDRVLGLTNLLIAVSDGVLEGYISNSKFQGYYATITNGCDYNFYAPSAKKIEEILKNPKRNRIFYQGNISVKIDFEMMFDLLTSMPSWEFLFCGPVHPHDANWEKLKSFNNFNYLGVLRPEEIREIAYSCSVGIVPFVKKGYIVDRSFPLKIFEYLACGLPVVSVPIKEVKRVCQNDQVFYATNSQEFKNAIVEAAKLRYDPKRLESRLQEAKKQDYETKFNWLKRVIARFENGNLNPNFLRTGKRNILVLYEGGSTHVGAISDHLSSFSQYSENNVAYIVASRQLKCEVNLDLFDVIVIHYSLRVSVNDGDWTLSDSYKEALKGFCKLKILFLQDEYDFTNVAKHWITELGVQTVFTCVPLPYIEKVYPKKEFPGVEFINNLTGYVPEQLANMKETFKPIHERKLLLAYRGRELPYWYGDLGQEKYRIGVKMREICLASNIPNDIEVSNEKRIYGKDWHEFLAGAKATLGTESGANIFDFDGGLVKKITALLEENPELEYEKVHDLCLKDHEGKISMNQISPKVFEAISLGTVLVLFEGEYSGVISPNEHFIPLKKDFSNVDEVLEKLHDDKYLSQIRQRAYDDIILSGKYSYRSFVKEFDQYVNTRTLPKTHVDFALGYVGFSKRAPVGSEQIHLPVRPEFFQMLTLTPHQFSQGNSYHNLTSAKGVSSPIIEPQSFIDFNPGIAIPARYFFALCLYQIYHGAKWIIPRKMAKGLYYLLKKAHPNFARRLNNFRKNITTVGSK